MKIERDLATFRSGGAAPGHLSQMRSPNRPRQVSFDLYLQAAPRDRAQSRDAAARSVCGSTVGAQPAMTRQPASSLTSRIDLGRRSN